MPRAGWRGFLDSLSSIALIAAAGVLVWTLLSRRLPPEGDTSTRVEVVSGLRLQPIPSSRTLGDGPIALVEFSDYECPFCRQYFRQTFPEVRRRLIDTGKIRYISYHFPLERIHPGALAAAVAAECAGTSGKFWDMHARIFGSGGGLDRVDLLRFGQDLGLARDLFERCLDGPSAVAEVRRNQQEGRRLGVSGTPVFFVGVVREDGMLELVKRIRGLPPLDVLADELRIIAGPRGSASAASTEPTASAQSVFTSIDGGQV